jgi:hypothetical protein
MKGGYDEGVRVAAATIALAVFVLNPSFGCGEEFDFGADEMRRAVEGTWELSFPGDTAPRAVLTLSHQAPQAVGPRWSPVPAAHACGNRSFMASAGACIATTGMSFHAQTLKVEEPFGPVSGAEFYVTGMSFRQGTLTVWFRNAVQFVVDLLPDGTVVRTYYTPANGAPEMPGLQAVRRP